MPLRDSTTFTYGQVAHTAIVDGKPSTHPVAMESLQILRPSNPSDTSADDSEAILKRWKEAKLPFLGWLGLTLVFMAFYVIYLNKWLLILGLGVVFVFITCLMYFSPWFKSADGIFTIMTFMVATFMTDFICSFLSIVFG